MMYATADGKTNTRDLGPSPRKHRDGTVSYWSYHQQEWIRHTIYVPAEELEMLPADVRARVLAHLGERLAG